jgi:hypothetical protein
MSTTTAAAADLSLASISMMSSSPRDHDNCDRFKNSSHCGEMESRPQQLQRKEQLLLRMSELILLLLTANFFSLSS